VAKVSKELQTVKTDEADKAVIAVFQEAPTPIDPQEITAEMLPTVELLPTEIHPIQPIKGKRTQRGTKINSR